MPPDQPLPPRIIAVSYLIALVCLLAPFGVIGVGFVAWVLVSRGNSRHAVGVMTLGIVCAVLGWTVLR